MKTYVKYGISFIVLALCFVLLFFCYRVDTLHGVLTSHYNMGEIENIRVEAFVSVFTDDIFDVDDKQSIEKLLELFKTIKVRRTYADHVFSPQLYSTYRIAITGEEDGILGYVNVLDNDYISVGQSLFRITGTADLRKIYEIAQENQPANR